MSVELLTLLVGGSGAVLACLDAGLDTRRRDVLDGKEVESNVTGTRVALDYEALR